MSSKTVLIVDDSSLITESLGMRLRSEGYKVATALDPGEAFALVRTEAPDAIIMDINFPPDVGFGGGGAWDGYRILEWMKLNKSLGNAVQFLITADDVEKHREKAMAAGVTEIFQKPIDAKALLFKLRECLQNPAPAT